METSSVDLVEFLRVLLTPRDLGGMSRPLRLEFEGAFWHITSRGNERKDIFRQDGDRLEFLSLLATAVKRFRWRLHEYCLMTNYYHLVIETPFRTLAKGMLGEQRIRPHLQQAIRA
jgi:REP element-mobilizing transposase RayT